MSRALDALRDLYPFRRRYDVIVLDHDSFANARTMLPDWCLFPYPGKMVLGGVPIIEGDKSYIVEGGPLPEHPIVHML